MHRAGVAEAAIERAADLAGNAQGAPVGIGDEDHFEIVAIGGAQQPFAGAIHAVLRLDHFGPPDHEAFRQPRAHRLGDVGHLGKFGDAAVIQPMIDLLGAQPGRLGIKARCGEQLGNARARHADQVDAPIRARGDVAGGGHGVGDPGDRHECGVGHGKRPYTRGEARWLAPRAAHQRGIDCGGGTGQIITVGEAAPARVAAAHLHR